MSSINLKSAASFAVLAATTITSAETTTINGNLGLYPGTSVTGPLIVNGNKYINDNTAEKAQADLTSAYIEAAGLPCGRNLTGETLGSGSTASLGAGVYCFNSSAEINGALTLNGSSSDLFVFQIGSSLTTASASSIVLTGGVSPCNVYFQVGSSATLGAASTFIGTIMALTSISLDKGVAVTGRLLARKGAVTLISDAVSVPTDCSSLLTVTKTSSASSVSIDSPYYYYLTINNNYIGSRALNNVVLTDVLPSNLSFVSANVGTYDKSDHTFSVSGLVMSAADVYTVALEVQASSPGIVMNSFSFTSNEIVGPINSNIVSTLITQPNNAAVSVTTSSPSLSVGQTFTYTIDVSNLSTSSINDVVLSDVAPSNVEVLSVSEGTYNKSNNTITISEIPASGSSQIVVRAIAASVGNVQTAIKLTSLQTTGFILSNTFSFNIHPLCPVIKINCDFLKCKTLIAYLTGGYRPSGHALITIKGQCGVLYRNACVCNGKITIKLPSKKELPLCFPVKIFYYGDKNNASSCSEFILRLI